MGETKEIPYIAAKQQFEVVYRNSSTSLPVNPHTHDAVEIYFTLTDLPDVLLNDTVSSVSSGSLIIIPPGFVHQLFNQRQKVYERYIITIRSSWLSMVLGENSHLLDYMASTSLPVILKLPTTNVTTLRKSLDHYLRNESMQSISGYADFFNLLTEIDAMITAGLHQKSSQDLTISTSQKNVNEIIGYINSHLTEPLTLDMIASHFSLNKDYLGRLFKKHTHATIGHYIAVQRAAAARNMLDEGRSVSQVQEALGFTSYAYFFRFFQKMNGISPSQYRKTK